MIRRIVLVVGAFALLGVPPLAQWWLTRLDVVPFQAVAKASLERRDLFLSAPRTGHFAIEEIPDRFVELLLEKPEEGAPRRRARTWFPSTFLWAPSVVTDATGHAEVPFTVPDALTEWRVLGLAMTEHGEPSGQILRFSSGQPQQVRLWLPPRARVGDEIALPIQVINDGPDPVAAPLTVDVDGRVVHSSKVRLASGEATTVTVPIRADTPGRRSITARWTELDEIRRPLTVEPRGWVSRTVLGGPVVPRRTIRVPSGEPGFLRLRMLAVRDVLERARAVSHGSADPEHAVYRWALACVLEDDALRRSASIAIPVDHDLESLQVLATLSGIRCSTHASPWLRDRSHEAHQLADGSWTVPSGAPLSHLLSLAAIRTVAASSQAVSLQSASLFERHGDRVTDPFSAGLVLWAGLRDEGLEERLREQVRSGARIEPDGTVRVLGEGTRPDGRRATDVDVLAAAALGMPPAEAATYRAALAGRLDPATGWGDAMSSLLAMTAMAGAPPVHSATSLHLAGPDGVQGSVMVGQETSVPLPGDARVYTLAADGPASDVAWQLVVERWHRRDSESPRLEATIRRPRYLALGTPGLVEVWVSAPRDVSVDVHHALPAGVDLVPGTATVDGEPVDARTVDGGVTLSLRPGRPQTVRVRYEVRATLAGTVHDGGVRVGDAEEQIWRGAADAWRVVGGG
ncbi:MAG: hypothetical protein KTR31_16785 [Myxococcales bacterium]|nr:hypothetical protein [Myxococcales bacterium]